jgi:hypothetical protein
LAFFSLPDDELAAGLAAESPEDPEEPFLPDSEPPAELSDDDPFEPVVAESLAAGTVLELRLSVR